MNRQSRIFTVILSFIVIMLIMAGCQGATQPAALTASEIITGSSQKMQAINSFHFELDQAGGGTPIASGLVMTKAAGDVGRPDRLKTTVSGTISGMFLEVQIVTVGEVMYMKNPLTGKWEKLPVEFSVMKAFDPDTGIAAIISSTVDLTKLDDEDLEGVVSYHLKGNIDSKALSPLIVNSVEGLTIQIEVWVGKEDLLVRRIRLEGKITEAEVEGIIRTFKLSNFNEEVSIEAPI